MIGNSALLSDYFLLLFPLSFLINALFLSNSNRFLLVISSTMASPIGFNPPI